jgi:hypothetical protein
MAVGNKYPNESRHETALRYIRDFAESNSGKIRLGGIRGRVMDSAETIVCDFCGNVVWNEYGMKRIRSCVKCFAYCKPGDKVKFAAPGRDTFNWGSDGLERDVIYTIVKVKQYQHGRGVWVNGIDKEFHSMIFVPADAALGGE